MNDMQKGTIIIAPDDIKYCVLGSWILPLILSFTGPDYLAKFLASGALYLTVWLLVYLIIHKYG